MFELTQRIRQKYPESELIDDLIEALVEENLVSDERFAESFVRSRVRRSQGPVKIRAALRAKGVDDSDIARALAAFNDHCVGMARDWVQGHHAGEVEYETRPKLYRKLLNRGFSHEQAMSALN